MILGPFEFFSPVTLDKVWASGQPMYVKLREPVKVPAGSHVLGVTFHPDNTATAVVDPHTCPTCGQVIEP